MIRWLVRTSHNEIHGPFAQQELIDAIQAGKWTLQDEACRENHYWFCFSEPEELSKNLGISWPSHCSSSSPNDEETDEITATETKILSADAETLEILHQHGRSSSVQRVQVDSEVADSRLPRAEGEFEEPVFWKQPLFWLASIVAIALALWLSSR